MNCKAIVVYVDDTKQCLEEFSWLYKTWRLWKLDNEFDLVAYHNPSAVNNLPVYPNLILKPLKPLHKNETFWKEYPFVNSFAMFNEQAEVDWFKERYTHIMKTDCDVFLTKHFAGHAPTRMMIGVGGYMPTSPESDKDSILENLKRIANNLKLKRNGFINIGASIFGKTNSVLNTVKIHFIITKYLLTTEWKEDKGKWPGWNIGVASMYAIDIVVNHLYTQQHINLYSLDEKCWKHNVIDKNTIHIHAWHSYDYFSKHDWFEGKYEKLTTDKVPTNAAEYCHWIVSNDLETLMDTIKNEEKSHMIYDDWGNEIKE